MTASQRVGRIDVYCLGIMARGQIVAARELWREIERVIRFSQRLHHNNIADLHAGQRQAVVTKAFDELAALTAEYRAALRAYRHRPEFLAGWIYAGE